MNLAECIERRVEQFPARLAIHFGGERYTYEQFWAQVNRFGNGLRSLGIGKTDRVAMMLPNCVEALIVHWGVVKIGATFAPVNTMFKEKDLKFILNNSAATVAVTSTHFLQFFENVWTDCSQLEHLIVIDEVIAGTVEFHTLIDASSPELDIVQCDSGQPAELYYTSGTTGRPKGVMKTHLSVSKMLEYTTKFWRLTERDHSMVVLPLFHSYAMIVPSMTHLYVGGAQTIMDRWDTKTVLDTIVQENITFFAGVPTMYTYMVRFPGFENYDLTCIRIPVVGGASLPVEIQREFEERAEVRLVDAYGCTGWISSLSPPDGPHKHGSLGKSLRDIDPEMDTDMKIVGEDGRVMPPGEPGEMVVRGAQLPPGFWRMPAKTRETYRDGWCYTGDICYKDADGFYFLLDRMDDLIITSGYNVYPREIEEILYTHPKVNECAVIGYPDPEKGHAIIAYISLKPGITCNEEEIVGFCRQHIANFKVPRKVEFLTEIPKTANGKIYKKGLRDK